MCRSGSDALPSSASASRRGRSSSSSASASRRGRSSSSAATSTATTSTSTGSQSLAAARASLPDPPPLYTFQEITKATNNFLSKRASSSSYWRCSLRGRDAALFQLRARATIDAAQASAALAAVARYHHTSLARLLGACLAGPHVYLAYELPPGAATLSACLRGGNPSFTALPTWLSRVQVATDIAQGLEYIHHHAAAVHGRVSPSNVLVSDPGLRARLTHFGAGRLAAGDGEEEEESREADVRAFGVLLLELLSGEDAAAKYRLEQTRGRGRGRGRELVRVSVVDTAAEAASSGRVRSWVDGRLGDSFPVASAERLLEVGLRCAAAAAAERPDMTWVAGKVSRVYVEARAWEQRLRPPTHGDGSGFSSVSMAPR